MVLMILMNVFPVENVSNSGSLRQKYEKCIQRAVQTYPLYGFVLDTATTSISLSNVYTITILIYLLLLLPLIEKFSVLQKQSNRL